MEGWKSRATKLLLAGSLIILTAVCWSRHAEGGTALRWFGNDARNAGMGGTGVALGQGPGNLLVNPSLMSFNPGGIWLTFSAAPSWLHIDPKNKDPESDVPLTIYDEPDSSWNIDGRNFLDRPVPTEKLLYARRDTEDLETVYQVALTYIFTDFSYVPSLRIGLGVTMPMPEGLAYNIWYNDEREQHFTNRLHFDRFGEFDTIMAVYPAISYAPLEWLSLGVSCRVDLGISVDAGMYLPYEGEYDYAYITSSGDISPIFRPIAGLALKTPMGFRFGATYRHESYAEGNLNAWLSRYGSDGVVEQRHKMVLGYEPIELALAAGFERGPFQFEVGGTFEAWSRHLDHHHNHRSHPTWDTDDDTSVDGWDDDWEEPEFSNVFSIRTGTAMQVTDFAAVRAGFAFFPSPAPSQTGRYNYVDNDILMYSLGGGFRFPIMGWPVTVDIAAQLWHMKAMSVNKDPALTKEEGGVLDEVPNSIEPGLQTNNPGYPGYDFGGVVLNAVLMVGTEFN